MDGNFCPSIIWHKMCQAQKLPFNVKGAVCLFFSVIGYMVANGDIWRSSGVIFICNRPSHHMSSPSVNTEPFLCRRKAKWRFCVLEGSPLREGLPIHSSILLLLLHSADFLVNNNESREEVEGKLYLQMRVCSKSCQRTQGRLCGCLGISLCGDLFNNKQTNKQQKKIIIIMWIWNYSC